MIQCMEPGGLHPDTPLTASAATIGSPERGSGSLAVLADELVALLDRADELTAIAAQLVRDGADDPHPKPASLDLMLAAGRLAHLADVVSALGLVQVDTTGAHCEDA